MNEEDKPNNDQDPSPPPPPAQEPEKINPATDTPATAQQLTEVEEQMSGFEKSTLRWAKTAVIMSGLAAIFVCAQWWEMHEGGVDTHNLATAAGNQATWTQHLSENMKIQGDRTKDLADRMKDQADRTQTLADRMKDQADRTKTIADQAVVQANAAMSAAETADKQLKMSERPWIGLSNFSVVGSIHSNASKVRFDFSLANVGKSMAMGINFAFWVAGSEKGRELIQGDKCEKMASEIRVNLGILDKGETQNNPFPQKQPNGLSIEGYLLVPGGTAQANDLPQEGAPDTFENNVYVLSCIRYFDQLHNVHLTQNAYCFIKPDAGTSDLGQACGWGNYAY